MIVPSACNAAEPGDIAKTVLMPGDPLRAKYIAETYLEQPKCFNTVRGMLGFTGKYRGKEVSVMGSGMGIPSMGLYSYELYNFFGVENIIRVGSTGALAADVKLRDVIVAIGASTNSNFACQYGFQGYLAPVADFGLLEKAVSAARAKELSVRVGPVFSSDMFYNAEPGINEKCRDMGLLAVEMETAGLYYTAAYCRKKALSILTVSDHIFTGEELSAKDREQSFNDMMVIALETA